MSANNNNTNSQAGRCRRTLQSEQRHALYGPEEVYENNSTSGEGTTSMEPPLNLVYLSLPRNENLEMPDELQEEGQVSSYDDIISIIDKALQVVNAEAIEGFLEGDGGFTLSTW